MHQKKTISLGFAFLLVLLSTATVFGQSVPHADENIPFLVTFGPDSPSDWGDDDKTQIFFFSVPQHHHGPVFIRILDPDVGGDLDENRGGYNSRTRFTIVGGRGTITNKAARTGDPDKGYDAGLMLDSRVFGESPEYDGKWFSFGPFNPNQGELSPDFGGYIFKVIAKGIQGDDGNNYKYFLSSSPRENNPIEGGNSFTFEYSFRLPDNRSVCHIYPYVDQEVVSFKQSNFDWDEDGIIRVVSNARNGENFARSGDGGWAESTHKIYDTERNTSLDVQILKTSDAKFNNVVFRITNQYDEALPFFSVPIGGIPQYELAIGARVVSN